MPGQLGDDEKRQRNSTGRAGDASPLPIPAHPGGTVVNWHRLFFIWVIFMTGKKLNNPDLKPVEFDQFRNERRKGTGNSRELRAALNGSTRRVVKYIGRTVR